MSSKITTSFLIVLIIISFSLILGSAPGLTGFFKLIPAITAFLWALYSRRKILCVLAGICIVLTVVFNIFYIAIMEPTEKRHREMEMVNTIEYNLHVVGQALIRYANNNNGCLPLADKWCDLLLTKEKGLTKANFENPQIKGSVIAFNKNLGGKNIAEISGNTVLLFEAQGDWNLTGDEELLLKANPTRNTVDMYLTFYLGAKVMTYYLDHHGVENWRGKIIPVKWKPS